MIPRILKNMNVFVDGRGYAGRVEELTLPKLTIKTEEFRGAGMDAPIEIDMGMEKLEMDLTFAEYDAEIFKLFGLVPNRTSTLMIRGACVSNEEASSVVIHTRGFIKEIDMGVWKAGEKASAKTSFSCEYFKLIINNEEIAEIDIVNMIRKINGSDQLEIIRNILAI